VTDLVAEFRQNRVGELDALFNACRMEQLDPATETPNLVARLRELYFFSPDFRSLVEHLNGLAKQYAIADWAKNNTEMSAQPWSRISAAFEEILTEPPLYQRDWSQGPIEPQFREAIGGWVDLADCARSVQANSARQDFIDVDKLVAGTMNLFRSGCEGYFERLQTAGTDQLEDIFNAIFGRDDCNFDMFPAALTYFGSDGLAVLNQLSTEHGDLYDALLGYADRQVFDAAG
jgi:hypothetical protein